MEGIRKYKELYKIRIEESFDRAYNGLKKMEISNEERLKRVEGYINKNIKWVNLTYYLI